MADPVVYVWRVLDAHGQSHSLQATQVVNEGPLVRLFNRGELVGFFVNPPSVTRGHVFDDGNQGGTN